MKTACCSAIVGTQNWNILTGETRFQFKHNSGENLIAADKVKKDKR